MTFYGKFVLNFNKTKPVAETPENISEKHLAVKSHIRLFSKKYFLFLIVILF